MLSQLPARAARILYHDPQAALASPENTEVLAWPTTNAVVETFARKVEQEAGSLTPERFKELVNEVKTEVGVKGKELFHPIRVVVTGAHSGPEFDKVIPIIEQGSRLKLPRHVPSVRERVEAFVAAKHLPAQP